jgi:hypothetical protein
VNGADVALAWCTGSDEEPAGTNQVRTKLEGGSHAADNPLEGPTKPPLEANVQAHKDDEEDEGECCPVRHSYLKWRQLCFSLSAWLPSYRSLVTTHTVSCVSEPVTLQSSEPMFRICRCQRSCMRRPVQINLSCSLTAGTLSAGRL